MESKELDQKFASTEVHTLKGELTKMAEDNGIKGQRIEELNSEVDVLKRDFAALVELLQRKPRVAVLQQELRIRDDVSSRRMPPLRVVESSKKT